MSNRTFDPNAGTAMTFTANGYVPTSDLTALLRAEAERLRKQDVSEPEFV